jgi:hypothetical protein
MNSNLTHLVILILFTTSVFSQTKSDEWNLHASSRKTTLVCYGQWANGIVTDDTPLKTKEIILNGL